SKIFIAIAVLLITLEIWSTDRTERESRELPGKIAEYFKNITPPPGVSVGLPGAPPQIAISRPMPPEGLVAAVDGDWGMTARSLSTRINQLISSQGEPPSKA